MEDLIRVSVCGATRWPWGDSYLCCGNPRVTAQIMSASQSCQGQVLPSQQVVWRTPHCWLWCGPSWLLFCSSWGPAPCALTPMPSLQTVTRTMVLPPPLRQPTNTCAHLAPDSPSTLSDLRSTCVSHTFQIHRHLTITRIQHIFVTPKLPYFCLSQDSLSIWNTKQLRKTIPAMLECHSLCRVTQDPLWLWQFPTLVRLWCCRFSHPHVYNVKNASNALNSKALLRFQKDSTDLVTDQKNCPRYLCLSGE